MIPEGWSRKNLKDVIEGGIKNGYSPLPAHNETGLWVLGLGALQEGEIKLSEVKPAPDDNKVKASFLESGDFLVSRSNTPEKVGRVAVFRGESERYSYPDLMMRFRINEREASPRFMEQLLKSPSVRGYFRSSSAGSSGSMVKINKSVVEKTPLLLPPMYEQEKIARVLSAWDAAITISERLVETGQQQKLALMQNLLTGKRRLPGFAVHAGWRHEKYGDVPNDWGFVEIGSFSRQSSEKNRETEELPVLSCSKYDGFVDSLSYFNKRVYSEDLSGYKVIRRGDIGFPSNHVEEGSIGLQNLYDRGLVSPIYVVFRPDEERVDPEFLFRLLKTDHYRQVFAASTNASVDRRGSLRWKEFSAIKVPLPSLDEQKAIVLALKTADAEIQAQQQRLDCLRQEKKALMQQLLTGKRRVKVEATTPTEEAAC